MMKRQNLKTMVIATGNHHKFVEFRDLLAPLGVTLLFGKDLCPALNVEETGETFLENATIKAVAWTQATGLPALADDSGIEVDALDGRPGVYSARYAATDAACRKRLLGELDGQKNRHGRYVAALVLASGKEVLWSTVQTCEGTVIDEERGSGGFGYDSLFVPKGESLTFAEMSQKAKDKLSHRGKAVSALLAALTDVCDTINN